MSLARPSLCSLPFICLARLFLLLLIFFPVCIPLSANFDALQASAARGIPSAQRELGLLYSRAAFGDSVAQKEVGTEDQETAEAKSILFLFFAASGGDEAASMSMGFRHLYGIQVPRSCATAIQYYRASCKNIISKNGTLAYSNETLDPPRSILSDAIFEGLAGNPVAAIEARQSQANNSNSFFGLGPDWFTDSSSARASNSQGYSAIEESVLLYLRTEAERGDAASQLTMAQLLLPNNMGNKHGIKPDIGKAFSYLEAAAASGSEEAMSALAHLILRKYLREEEKQQVEIDIEKKKTTSDRNKRWLNNEGVRALQLLDDAASKGSPSALNALGFLHLHTQLPSLANLQRLHELKKKKAVEMKKDDVGTKVENSGKTKIDAEPSTNISWLPRESDIHRRERLSQAIQLFAEASTRGSPEALFNLASIFFAGDGVVEPDKSRALLYFSLAVRRGHVRAAWTLGEAYYQHYSPFEEEGSGFTHYKTNRNIGITVDAGAPCTCENAAAFFKAVAEQNSHVHKSLNTANRYISDDKVENAIALLSSLSLQGLEVAQTDIGLLLEMLAAKQDTNERHNKLARTFYLLAAIQGSPGARNRLGDMEYRDAEKMKNQKHIELEESILWQRLVKTSPQQRLFHNDSVRRDDWNSDKVEQFMETLKRKAAQFRAMADYRYASNHGSAQASFNLASFEFTKGISNIFDFILPQADTAKETLHRLRTASRLYYWASETDRIAWWVVQVPLLLVEWRIKVSRLVIWAKDFSRLPGFVGIFEALLIQNENRILGFLIILLLTTLSVFLFRPPIVVNENDFYRPLSFRHRLKSLLSFSVYIFPFIVIVAGLSIK
eukprot:g3738.t1